MQIPDYKALNISLVKKYRRIRFSKLVKFKRPSFSRLPCLSDRYFIDMSKSYVWLITAIGFVFLSAGIQGDTGNGKLPNKDNIFQFHFPNENENVFTTRSHLSVVTESGPDAETLYRYAVEEAIQLLDTQTTQINYTKIFFVDVWGAEDKEVQRIIARLNSMKTYLSQKLYILTNKLALREISQKDRGAMPVEWVTIDMVGRGWKEVERFIDEKCTQRNLTKAEEDKLHPLREWLKYSDQELAIPYDSMKENMERVMEVEVYPSYTLPPSSSTKIYPFSIH